MFNGLYANKGAELSVLVDDWSKKGREQQKFALMYVIHLLENTLRFTYLRGQRIPLPPAEAKFVETLSTRGLGADAIAEMVQTISDTVSHIERNAHSKTQLLAMMITLHHIVQQKKVAV